SFLAYSNVTTSPVNSTYADIVTWLSSNTVSSPVSNTSTNTLSPLTGATPITSPQQASSIIKTAVTQSIQTAAASGVISQSAAVQAIQAVQNNTVTQQHVPVMQTSLQNSVNQGTMSPQQANNNLNQITQIQNPINNSNIKQNPFQMIVGLFAAGLTGSFLIPRGGIRKRIRSSKRYKK
ncbi:MAG: hypothetical protein KGL95_13520, partial [Patescibacteria group bacterium]|nr:hypothetical protein [Patescibacteria group bacterium]